MLLLATFGGFVKGVLMLVFILSALLLMLVVLLQEPKGGGLSSAFGGAGAETFGVQTGSVNKFTAYVAAVFMGVAVLYAAWQPDDGTSVMDSSHVEQPAEEETPPAGGAVDSPGGAPAEQPPAEGGGSQEGGN